MSRKKIIPNRQERIIDAAENLFAFHTFEKTTMEQIARESGIPRATVYFEFPGGKEDILAASFKRYMVDLLLEMKNMVKQSRKSRLSTLQDIILFYILSAYKRSNHPQCDPDHVERQSQRIRAEMGAFFLERTLFFQEVLDQAVLTQELPENIDTSRLATLLTHALHSFLPPFNLRMSETQIQQDATDLFSLLIRSIRKR